MLRIIAVSCLVLVVFAKNIPLELDTPVEGSGVVQTFTEGQRQDGDELIWSENGGSQMNGNTNQIITKPSFPKWGFRNNAVITQIVASTELDSGESKFAIQSGGVGDKYFKLKIVTTNASKMSYKLQVYGKYQ